MVTATYDLYHYRVLTAMCFFSGILLSGFIKVATPIHTTRAELVHSWGMRGNPYSAWTMADFGSVGLSLVESEKVVFMHIIIILAVREADFNR